MPPPRLRSGLLLLAVAATTAASHCSAYQLPPRLPPSRRPPPPAIDRRGLTTRAATAATTGSALLLVLGLRSVPVHASEAREAIAKAASKLPGYGAPDTLFPSFFVGEWVLTREGAGVTVAQGKEAEVDPEDMRQAQQWSTERVSYPVRFLRYDEGSGGDGKVIADRGANEAALWRARVKESGKSELYLDAITSRWDRSNPNVLTVNFPDGLVREVKVTRRGVEEGSAGADVFGLSEFARVAEARQDTGVATVPRISAVRLLQKWKRTGPETIEGLELLRYYPPVSLSPEPPAVMTLKSRLRLERRPQIV